MKTKGLVNELSLVNALDKGSINLSRLAVLLKAQADEMEDCDTDMGGNNKYWKYHKEQIEIIGNIVMNRLKQISDKFGDLSGNAFMTGKFNKH